jgi:hypothetical protein
MLRTLLRSLLVFGPLLAGLTTGDAHDSWISQGGLKNAAGEWCCGSYDCKSYQRTSSSAVGWVVDNEVVPFDEAMPVSPPDGQLTICRRPDGTRRCVFGIKPAM